MQATDGDDRVATPVGRQTTGPMSVERTLAILNALADSREPMSLAALTRELDTPKPSVLSLVRELTALGYVRRDELGRIMLAGRSYRLALRIKASDSISVLVRDTLQRLSSRLMLTAALGYLDEKSRALVYADRYEAHGPIRYVVELSYPLEIHSRSLGKLLLAHQDEASWPDWLGAEPYRQFTPHTHTTYAELAKELHQLRQAGTSWSEGELHVGISGCSFPVRTSDGKVAAGLSIQGLTPALNAKRDEIEAALKSSAQDLTRELKLRHIDMAALYELL